MQEVTAHRDLLGETGALNPKVQGVNTNPKP